MQGAGEMLGGERECLHVRQREGQREMGEVRVCVVLCVCVFSRVIILIA